MSLPFTTTSSQIVNSVATFLLRRLTDLTETVTSYIGPPQDSDKTEIGATPANKSDLVSTGFHQPELRNFSGCIPPQQDLWSLNATDGTADKYRSVNKYKKHSSGLRVTDPGSSASPDKQASWKSPKRAQHDPKRFSSDCFVQTDESANFACGIQSDGNQLTDWCRWPVCAVHRWGGVCPLGENQCPDAHVGRDLLTQIDSNGLVRVCFESLGVGNRPCTRPKGCCRFFHPPEHICTLLIRRRHLATASMTTKRRQRKSASLSFFSTNLNPETHPSLNLPPGPNQNDSALATTDKHALEAIRLLSGLMDYGQLLRTCAAIMQPHQTVISGAKEPQMINEEKQEEEEELAAAFVNRQLSAYSSLTDALRVQLAIAAPNRW